MKRLIIGFGHKRQRGKSLACTLTADLLRGLQQAVRVDYFAASLKEGIGRGVFGFSEEQLHGALKTAIDPFWGITPRDVFQRFGTDVMHTQFGADIWTRTLLRRIEADTVSAPHILIGDVRFVPEVEALRRVGAWLIRIDRTVADQESAAVDLHKSETALDDWCGWDHVIANDGSVVKLQECLAAWLRVRFLESGDQVRIARNAQGQIALLR